MDTDLVSPSRFQHHRTVGDPPHLPQRSIVGHRMASVLGYRHFLPIRRMSGDGGTDGSLFLRQTADDQRPVFPVHGMVGKLSGQCAVCHIVFGHAQQTAGIPVDPMDDPRPFHAAHTGQTVTAVPQQTVDQCTGRMAGRRMDHHPLGLIDHQDIPVFIHDFQR